MKNIVIRLFLLCGLLFSLSLNANAEEKNPNVFYGRRFSSGEDTLWYRILYPKGYQAKSKTKFPLVIVLHDKNIAVPHGKATNFEQLNSTVAKVFKRKDVHDTFPAFVLFPQFEEDDPWTDFQPSDSANVIPFPEKPEQTYSGELLERLVKYYIKHQPVDTKRIYVIGEGPVGGSGALDLAARNGKTFAGVISLGGSISGERVSPLKDTYIRLYVAEKAVEVPPTLVNDAYIGLKAAGSQKVEDVVVYENVDANQCVEMATSTPDFLKWLFSKKKK